MVNSAAGGHRRARAPKGGTAPGTVLRNSYRARRKTNHRPLDAASARAVPGILGAFAECDTRIKLDAYRLSSRFGIIRNLVAQLYGAGCTYSLPTSRLYGGSPGRCRLADSNFFADGFAQRRPRTPFALHQHADQRRGHERTHDGHDHEHRENVGRQ